MSFLADNLALLAPPEYLGNHAVNKWDKPAKTYKVSL